MAVLSGREWKRDVRDRLLADYKEIPTMAKKLLSFTYCVYVCVCVNHCLSSPPGLFTPSCDKVLGKCFQ